MNRYLLSKAGIDVKEGLNRFNNNKAIYEKFLLNFTEDPYFAKLKETIGQNDVEEAFQAAHALKGVTGTLSMNEVFEALQPLVEDLRVGKIDRAEELLKPVEEKYNLVMETLKKQKEA